MANEKRGFKINGPQTFLRALVLALVAGLVVSGCALLQPNTGRQGAQHMFVSTIAGLPYVNSSVDGMDTDASFSHPWGVTVDHAGNVYVADFANVIRKLEPVLGGWKVTTIAGQTNGAGGWADGLGTEARFNGSWAITMDHIGNLYVTDPQNSAIRKLTPTPAGWMVGTLGEMGPADGHRHMSEGTRLNQPRGLAVDGTGNIIVANSGDNTIRKFTPDGDGWRVAIIAGQAGRTGHVDGVGTNALFDNPFGVAMDAAGNVFVTDYDDFTVRELKPVGTNWLVSTIAGQAYFDGNNDGTNNTAHFYLPTGIAVGRAGTVYVADSGNGIIRKLVRKGDDWVVTTAAGAPKHGHLDSTPVWTVFQNRTNWVAHTPKGGEDSGSTNDIAGFSVPQGLAVDSAGRVYVAGLGDHAIRLCQPGGPWPPPLQFIFQTNQMIVSWPASRTKFTLECSGWGPRELWQAVTNPVTVFSGRCVVTADLPAHSASYRLRNDALRH